MTIIETGCVARLRYVCAESLTNAIMVFVLVESFGCCLVGWKTRFIGEGQIITRLTVNYYRSDRNFVC